MHILRYMTMFVLASSLAILNARPAYTQTIELVGGEQVIWRPSACASRLNGGLFGFLFGYEHAGYSWTDDWQRDRILEPVHHSVAEYVPEGDPYFITSRDGRARWYEPRFVAECSVRETWRFGRIVESLYRSKVVRNLGRVVPISDGDDCSDAGARHQTSDFELTDPMYDPYASSGDDGDCSGDEGGGDGDGGGTPYQPGDYTGGETVDWATGYGNGGQSACGETARVEYICIDIYNPETGEWEQWSCGYATTC